MARTFTSTQASALYGAAIGEVWTTLEDAYNKNVFKQFLKEIKDPHAKRVTQQFAYFTQPVVKPEGEGIQYDDLKEGDPLSVDPEFYALGVRLTLEAIEKMRRQPFGSFNQSQLTSASRIAEAFRKACAQRKEIKAAALITGAQAVTGSAGRASGAGFDGKALSATDHPIYSNTSVLGGTTFSNRGAASALSQAALQTMLTTVETIPSLEGMVRPLGMKWKLLVGPGLRNTAYSVIETTRKGRTPGTTDHDVPGLSDFDIEVVVNPFLGASSTVYALIGPDHGLGYWEFMPEKLDDEADFETKGHKYSIIGAWNETHEHAYDLMQSAGA